MTLIITYKGDSLQDGVGSQLQRILGIYALSKEYGLSYAHTPISKSTTYDFDTLKFRELTQAELQATAALFAPTPHSPSQADEVVSKNDITLEELHLWMEKAKRHPILLRLVLPYGAIEQNTQLYRHVKGASPFFNHSAKTIDVVVHIRRGELPFIAPSRLLPSRYYVQLLRRVILVLEGLNLNFQITVFTEATPWDFDAVSRQTFAELPVTVVRNSAPIEPFRRMAEADILVVSHSSYSYSAALLNPAGIILYHPFWHAPLPDWITTTNDGNFDVSLFISAIAAKFSIVRPIG